MHRARDLSPFNSARRELDLTLTVGHRGRHLGTLVAFGERTTEAGHGCWFVVNRRLTKNINPLDFAFFIVAGRVDVSKLDTAMLDDLKQWRNSDDSRRNGR